jgi:hypothetical protein
MDKLLNWRVRNALEKLTELTRSIRGIHVRLMNWNMTFKGVDDYKPTRRTALADAFRSATGDIDDRFVVRDFSGPQIIKVYCRDNKAPNGIISRELVKETVHEDTNEYKKLANISFSKAGQVFSYDNLVSDHQVDPLKYCLEAQKLFELYQECAGRRQIETLLENYVDSMQAVKLARGRIYFIPRDFMAKLTLFEDFIQLLEQNNQYSHAGRVPMDSNSMFVVDDAKQREKMAAAFYRTVRAEIAEYEERAAHLIQSGNQSPAIMERCVLRVRGLEQKKSPLRGDPPAGASRPGRPVYILALPVR